MSHSCDSFIKFNRKMGCISSKAADPYDELVPPKIVNKAKTKSQTTAKKTEKKQPKSNECDTEQRSITPTLSTNSRLSRSIRKTWTDEELLCKLKFLNPDTSSNIVRLFDEGNTIPFMCRYRREYIGNLGPDE